MPDRDPAPSTAASWVSLPTPVKMEQYERAVPGTAERLLAMLESQQRHAQRVQVMAMRIRIFGYACGLASVLVLAVLAKYFADSGAPTQGAAIAMAGTASLVGTFVTGRLAARRAHGAGGREATPDAGGREPGEVRAEVLD
ncbi:DUF2335 domain-containing protein [Dactylosporangium sp. CS-047395]|uniref:DUF2335 domain-containing protein n=1 Tax=Dactylosporangium sp. CS-047395 TaxID=3239936 RepID=UPI003D8D9934